MENAEQVKKGTTTVCVACKDAVVLAADKRATMGYLISNKEVEKIFRITDRIALTIAGAVGDGFQLARLLKAEMDVYRLNTGIEPSLTVASSLLGNIVYAQGKSFMPYIVQLILGGEDDNNEYAIYNMDMLGGNIREKQYTTTGSGSPIAFGVLEDNYKPGLTEEDAVELAIRAVSTAIKRDCATGEGVDVVVINKKGFRKLEKEKVAGIIKAK